MIEMTVTAQSSVDVLLERITALVAERQALRERSASHEALEDNRIRIARAQQELSSVLIERHLPKPTDKRAA